MERVESNKIFILILYETCGVDSTHYMYFKFAILFLEHVT